VSLLKEPMDEINLLKQSNETETSNLHSPLKVVRRQRSPSWLWAIANGTAKCMNARRSTCIADSLCLRFSCGQATAIAHICRRLDIRRIVLAVFEHQILERMQGVREAREMERRL
jgi:hypothetical protein